MGRCMVWVTVLCWRSVVKMCVVADLFVVVVIGVWAGIVFCCVSLWLVLGVGLVVFIVGCVAVVVVVDYKWKTVENMVDVMVFVNCWYLVWWAGGLSISSSIMEYGLVIFKSSSRSRPRSGPRRSTSNLPPLNKIISLSKILSSNSLFIWLFMTCVNNCLANLRVVNDFCLCVVRVRVCVGLCVGNDAIYLNVCSVLHDLSFSESRWKIGKIGNTYQYNTICVGAC